jgi:hypothetical protein
VSLVGAQLTADRGLTWEKVRWFKENTKMEIWLKGSEL